MLFESSIGAIYGLLSLCFMNLVSIMSVSLLFPFSFWLCLKVIVALNFNFCEWCQCNNSYVYVLKSNQVIQCLRFFSTLLYEILLCMPCFYKWNLCLYIVKSKGNIYEVLRESIWISKSKRHEWHVLLLL